MQPHGKNNLAEAVAAVSERSPRNPALTYADRTWTYGQLAEGISRVAGGLCGLHVDTADRVALILPNRPEFILAYMATVSLGATVVPVPPMLAGEEIVRILRDARPVVVITVGEFAELAKNLHRAVSSVRHIVVCGVSADSSTLSWEEFNSGEPLQTLPDIAPNTPAALVYTGGTTGQPKGAVLTHKNILANVRQCSAAIPFTETDRFVTVLPLFHCFGATVSMHIPALVGAHNVLLPNFSPLHTLEAIDRAGATIIAGVPTMYTMMLQVKSDTEYDLSSLRFAVSGGAPLRRETWEAFRNRWDVNIVEGYGPTEASPVVSCNRPGRQRVGSVGPPLPGVEVGIFDDAMNRLTPGEIGEICVRGENVMAGYHRAPGQTAETVVNGWLRTGDLGRVDEDGFLHIVDRKKDLIIVGGMNVYPREVEQAICRHPDVVEAAVVGAPHHLRGEVVTAYVVPVEAADIQEIDIIEHCREHLAAYKVPRRVNFAEALPRSPIGKVLKRELRSNTEYRTGDTE
ncbi:MAG: long-chain-fatty-acid--CoA ligase [Armatimonadota bacterium]